MKEPPQPSSYPLFNRLISNGDLLEEAAFIALSGLDEEGLSIAITAGRLFYVSDGSSRAYPKFFLSKNLPFDLVAEICVTLGRHLSGNVKWLFWTQARGSLATQTGMPRTPLQAIADGEVELVRRCAQARADE